MLGQGGHVGAPPVTGRLTGGELCLRPAGAPAVKVGRAADDPKTRASVGVGDQRVSEKSLKRFLLFRNGLKV